MKYNYRLSHEEADLVLMVLSDRLSDMEGLSEPEEIPTYQELKAISDRVEKQVKRWREFEQEIKDYSESDVRGGGGGI